MRKALIACAAAALALSAASAQEMEKYPLGDYQELTDTKPHDGAEVWDALKKPVELGWGSIDTRYK